MNTNIFCQLTVPCNCLGSVRFTDPRRNCSKYIREWSPKCLSITFRYESMTTSLFEVPPLEFEKRSPSTDYDRDPWPHFCELWSPLNGHITFGRQLGFRRNGFVMEAWYNMQHVSLEMCNININENILSELINETYMCEHLKELQGFVVPRVFGHGALAINGTIFMALALEFLEDQVQGNSMDNRRAKYIGDQDNAIKDSVLRYVDCLHNRGVAHMDPREYNIILVKSPSDPKAPVPRILDFGFALIGASEMCIADDKKYWVNVTAGIPNGGRLYKKTDTTGTTGTTSTIVTIGVT